MQKSLYKIPLLRFFFCNFEVFLMLNKMSLNWAHSIYKGSTQIVLVTLTYGKQDLRKLACKPFKESFNF
jgi:hypothetical protein